MIGIAVEIQKCIGKEKSGDALSGDIARVFRCADGSRSVLAVAGNRRFEKTSISTSTKAQQEPSLFNAK